MGYCTQSEEEKEKLLLGHVTMCLNGIFIRSPTFSV